MTDPSDYSTATDEGEDSSPAVPREVLEFFAVEEGRTLLVRGEPGAGKTLFAIRLLDCLSRASRDVLYATTRVDQSMVLDEYLENEALSLDRTHIADLSRTGPDDVFGIDDEIDFDRTTADGFFEWLESISDVSDRFTIVFDSWELIGRAIETPRGHLMEHELATFARNHGINIVFVAEAVQQSDIDYLMDGVVSLTVEHDERGRPERTLRLEKLRGVRIGNRTQPYTLSKGRFTAFSPTDVSDFRQIDENALWESTTNTKRRFSSGVPSLDELLNGGYRRGSVVHLELKSGLSPDTWSLLIVPLVRNFLAGQQGSLVVSPADTSPGLLRRELDSVLPDSRFDSYCEVIRTSSDIKLPTDADRVEKDTQTGRDANDVERASQSAENTAESPSPQDSGHYIDYFERAERLRDRSDGPLLHVIGMETASRLDITLTSLADYVAVHNDLATLVTKPASERRMEVQRVADAHLTLERRSETLFLRGESPLTPLLGIDIDQSEMIPKLELTEAV